MHSVHDRIRLPPASITVGSTKQPSRRWEPPQKETRKKMGTPQEGLEEARDSPRKTTRKSEI